MRGIDAVLQELPGGIWDIQIGFDGDIETEDSFDTYMIVALFTDRRADESEVPQPERRRGWVGNEHTPGFEMGSKVWLYEQARLTRATMNDIQEAAVDALGSMVEEDLAVAVRGARVERTTERGTLEVEVLRSNDQVAKRYFDFWQNTGTP